MLGADEPDNKDNFKKAANCAQLDKDGAWRDRSCRRKYKFVCEKKDSERLVTERRARMQHASGPKDLPSSSDPAPSGEKKPSALVFVVVVLTVALVCCGAILAALAFRRQRIKKISQSQSSRPRHPSVNTDYGKYYHEDTPLPCDATITDANPMYEQEIMDNSCQQHSEKLSNQGANGNIYASL